MLVIVLVMLLTVLLAGGVLAFVAYPMRGREVPRAGRLNRPIARTAEVLPILDPEAHTAVRVPRARGSEAGAHRA